MLDHIGVSRQSLSVYEASAGAEAIAELHALAAPLRGARVLHINATPYGGGVAEILRSEIPLLRDLGIQADWRIITGDETFFSVTKKIHNGLQGAMRGLTLAEQETYLSYTTSNGQALEDQYDLIVVHDPQPLALCQVNKSRATRWIWRCHIDTCEPNPLIWRFLRPFLASYDAAIFTREEFVPHDIPVEQIAIIPPAIDPESPKNMGLGADQVRQLARWLGVDLDRPLVVQVSRFDPWKDPLGVIRAYRMVKRELPGLQLALVGSLAYDDPEGMEIYRSIVPAAEHDRDLHVFTNLMGVSNMEVNALQRLATVAIQKSLREGFGLVVSETLWKSTPVVAGRAGGIPLQIQDGVGGYLVDSVEACAERMLWLLHHPEEAREIGERGCAVVRDRFLITRLIADELRLYGSLLRAPAAPDGRIDGAGRRAAACRSGAGR
jgi:trehalose synthase